MTIQEQFAERIYRAAQAFRNEMIAAKTDGEILPVDEIEVTPTADGVAINFFKSEKKASKKAKPTLGDE